MVMHYIHGLFLTERLRLVGLNRTLVEVLIDKYLVRERLSGLEHHAFAQPLYLTLRSAIHKDDLEELGLSADYENQTRGQ